MNLKFFAGALAVILIIALPLFGHLSELPIQRWDEARLAIAAYEMLQTGNLLIPTIAWQPDMVSVKPPLQIWLMAVSMKLLGANELAVRLPSALTALVTCLFMYWFTAIKMRNKVLGIMAVSILVAVDGYVRLHGTRTGDYDTLLTLCTTVFLLYFYLYLRDDKPRYIIIATVALVLGCLTKGVAALMCTPAVLLYIISSGKIKQLFTTREFYVGLAVFVLFVPGYYLLREHYNPGYLDAVWRNDLGGRYLQTLENHHEPWYFYFVRLIERDHAWFVFSMAAISCIFLSRDKTIQSLTAYISLAAFSFLVVISASGTKLDWYNLPMYPLLALLAAIFVYELFAWLKSRDINPFFKFIVPALFIGTLYFYSYSKILVRVLKPDAPDEPQFVMGRYLNEVNKGKRGEGRIVLLYSDLEQDMIWYDYVDCNITMKSVLKLVPGDEAIAQKEESIAVLEGNYSYTLIENFYGLKRYRITGIKEIPITPPQ